MDKMIVNDELIARYLTGNASPEEAMAVHEWLEIAEHRILFEKFESAWHEALPSGKPRPIAREDGWKNLEIHFSKDKSQKEATWISPAVWRIAALLVIGLTVGYLVYVNRLPVLVSVTANNIREVTLPDSSVTVMNKEAVISYPEEFKSTRKVALEKGEAFFKVVHSGKPFVVHTSLADVRVVGTAFNVSLSDGKLDVTVEEGRVLVVTPTDSMYLNPGFSGSVTSDTTPMTMSTAENRNISSYATRKFIFRDAPLQEVFLSMEKAYPYTFTMQNARIGDCKLTASFDNVSAEYMLNLIAESLSLSIKKNDHGFVIEGSGCP